MQIIRIEHPETGNGIFSRLGEDFACDKINSANELQEKHRKFPTPYTEGLDFNSDYYCAFKTIGQFQRWIKKLWLKELLALGFRVYLVEVDEFLKGKMQICFKKESIINKNDITDLFII